MTFRTRVAAAIGVVVAVGVFLACFFAYHESRDALEGSADSSLSNAFRAMLSEDGPELAIAPEAAPGVTWYLAGSNGNLDVPGSAGFLQADSTVRAVAEGKSPQQYRTVIDDRGFALRELIVPVTAGTIFNDGQDVPFQTVRPTAMVLAENYQGVEDRLASLRDELLVIAALGIVLAALFGWLATRAALVPLRDTTREIEGIAKTLDVSHRFDEGLDDELGRLRRAFNRLLEEVERSEHSQRQLILDASHELRTPLTSLRANAQVLGRIDELEGDDVSQLSDDMVTQVDELTRLVGDLTELTQGERSVEPSRPFDLADLVGECAEIAETHARTKQVVVEVSTSPCTVDARRNRVARAVGNLLDNAIKFSPEHGTVAVSCRDGVVTVEDDGPGVDEVDRPHAFDRFYRSPRDRGLPGSGLGLAIVAQVAAEADGTVEISTSERLGGARLVLRLPLAHGNGFSPVS